MKSVLTLIAIAIAAVGLSACEPKTQPQKDFVEFKKFCYENPKNEACVKYREEQEGSGGALKAGGA